MVFQYLPRFVYLRALVLWNNGLGVIFPWLIPQLRSLTIRLLRKRQIQNCIPHSIKSIRKKSCYFKIMFKNHVTLKLCTKIK